MWYCVVVTLTSGWHYDLAVLDVLVLIFTIVCWGMQSKFYGTWCHVMLWWDVFSRRGIHVCMTDFGWIIFRKWEFCCCHVWFIWCWRYCGWVCRGDMNGILWFDDGIASFKNETYLREVECNAREFWIRFFAFRKGFYAE